MRIKVLAFTSIRSDYDLMSLVYSSLAKDDVFDLKLVVSGSHLSHEYGMTVSDIYSDGFDILIELETLINGDARSSRLKTAANFLISVIDPVRSFSPDLIIFSGDREDALAVSMLGIYLNIPTIHFFAGDQSLDGYVDNPVRHAASKLATSFFVSTKEHAERLVAIGESPARIFITGSVALDKFMSEPHVSKDFLSTHLMTKQGFLCRPIAILIFHPVMEEVDIIGDRFVSCVESLISYGYYVMIGSPNSDPGHHVIFDAIDRVAELDYVSYYGNIPRNLFVNLLRVSSVIVGNSSAGILEAASVPIPAINIGLRQKGRFAGRNVFFVDDENGLSEVLHDLSSICSLSGCAFDQPFVNPYGDGHSVDRAVSLMKHFDFSEVINKYEDPLLISESKLKKFAFDFIVDDLEGVS